MAVLREGDVVPHFDVWTIDAQQCRYSTIWQRLNLALVTLRVVLGIPAPSAIVADRWGEIVHVTNATDGNALPSIDALLEWLDFTASRCPECEGEVR